MTDKIVFTDGAVFDAASIISCKYTEQVNSETDVCPGAVCAAEVEVQLRAGYGSITQGTQFTYYKVDGSTETKIGVFTAEKPDKTSPYTYTVLAYDNITKSYKDASAWLRDNQDRFPMTLFSLVQTACSECGLSLANDSLPNGDFQVQAFYADGIQWVQILQWAAEAACRFVRCDADGKVEFSWYGETDGSGIGVPDKSARVAVKLTDGVLRTAQAQIYRVSKPVVGYLADTLTYEDYETAQLEKVQIKQSEDDVGVVYPDDEEKTNTYVIQGNMLLAPTSTDVLRPIAEYVYGVLSQVKYTPGSVTVFQSLNYRAGDIVDVYPQNGTPVRLYVTSAQFSESGLVLSSTGNPSRDSSSAVSQKRYSNMEGKMLEINASVDGLKITASTLKGDFAKLSLTVDGLSSEVSKTYTDLKNYVDTDAKDAAVQEAVRQASDSFDSTLEFYPTTVEMNSAIKQSASEIDLSVSQKLQGYVTDSDLNQYPTTVEMNSAISQSASEINLSVDRKLSGYATTESFSQFKLEYDSFKLEVVKDGEVRSAFAADTDSVTITSGVITFSSNTLAVNSDNFILDKTGNVTATGTFKTNNGVTGNGRNEAMLSSGGLTLYRTNKAGRSNKVVELYGTGENASLGGFSLFGPDASDNTISQFYITTSFTGSRLSMQNASGTASVVLNASSGDGVVKGNFDVQGSTGLGVSKTVNCQNLTAWGSKNRVVQTGFGPLKMAALETPEPTFADTGSAQCNGDGLCVLALDPRFAETTDRYKALKWLVTPTGAGSVWVEKGEGFAIVHGVPGLSFDWMCMGTQAGYADVYAERATEAPPAAHNPAYDQLDYVTDITETNRQRAEALIPSYDYGTLLSDLMEG